MHSLRQTILFFIVIILALIGLVWLHKRHPDAQRTVHTNHHFVIVVCSYKNEDIHKKNLDSIFAQTYKNFHVVYIDDNSPDNTHQAVQNYITDKKLEDKITLIKNPVNTRQLRNTYHAIHNHSNNDDIIVILDGDDWFAHKDVLKVLNTVYQDNNIWVTYGNYLRDNGSCILPGYYQPKKYNTATMRQKEKVPPPPLRTFYSWLFKQIPLKDLMREGAFIPMAADMAYIFPLVEMASTHHQPIQQALYIYNTSGALNCYHNTSSQTLQQKHAALIKQKPPYKALLEKPKNYNARLNVLEQTKVDLLTLVIQTRQRKTKPNHTTYLYDDMWVYQLGWQPELPFEYTVVEHLVADDANQELKKLVSESKGILPITKNKTLKNTVGIIAVIPEHSTKKLPTEH